MKRSATALGILLIMLLLLMAVPVRAQDDEPTAAERKTIADCLDKSAGDDELKQMSACIGLVAHPCPDAPGANTMTIVACQIREQKIWDDYLNGWYGESLKRLADEPNAAAASGSSESRFKASPYQSLR